MSRTARSFRSVVLAALAVGAALTGVGMGVGGATGAAASADPAMAAQSTGAYPAEASRPFAVQEVKYDRFEFEVKVGPDGDARWTFRYKRVLDNETDREDFEAFAAEFNANETEIYRNFKDRAVRLTARAENASGIDRPMNATGFRKEAYVTGVATDNLGVVEMSFRWTNAAAEKADGRVVLGDVFAGGFYLGPNQSMIVTAGEGLALDRAQPEPESRITGSVTYEGERTFGDRRPQVVFVPAATATTAGGGGVDPGATASPGGTASPTGAGDPGGDGAAGGGSAGFPLSWLALGAVLLLGVGAAVAYRAGAFGRGGGAGAAGTADSSSGGASGAETADPSAAETEPAVPDEELLSDEDRVVNLLEESGGRMKQVDIVEETGWSKSKVSMLLSEMEEEGTISKLRIGRENVISLAGHEPEAAGSPFDEED